MAKGKESKPHIGIFGRRNNGKSSLINALAQQDIAIVSETAGTTTDPVKKSMEITGIGPVILVDTAGIDDTGELGEKRIKKSMNALKTIDLAVLVVTENTMGEAERNLVKEFNDFAIPYFIVHNKCDIERLQKENLEVWSSEFQTDVIDFSATTGKPEEIVSALRKHIPESAYKTRSLVGDVISYGDIVLLITPIDIEAPEGRLILPQVQAIRDILDNDAVAVVAKEREVDTLLRRLEPKPALAITDSHVFLKADASIPKDIPLTSFSIVLARHKGDFENYIKGTPHISNLKDGDRLLILESCTHHVSCDDIGRVKIPRWVSNFTGKHLEYDVVSGLNDLPRDIHDYAMVIQCGGCVLTRKQLINRLKPAVDAGVPVSNYGMTIAYIHGIYERAIAPFVQVEENAYNYL
ncbi:MAG: [FeFe] hydrogenase H-cluster maturation GTPase HydF [Bacteroidales bacterium]|nr:[FeFe] hydrogenase H-cluster maturation GTPase HydF [Bacteroidales bacterium]MCF8334047.1 [FeFe] hydrogenase H-cluster maturation GTPase HydF [Bacteroidales bacterium]